MTNEKTKTLAELLNIDKNGELYKTEDPTEYLVLTDEEAIEQMPATIKESSYVFYPKSSYHKQLEKNHLFSNHIAILMNKEILILKK